jgi:class 3 adenylate cyclase/DNA-binding transcriptional ArsR family regulator
MTERALDRLDWGQVYALASDVLLLDPDNTEARVLRDLAERRGGRNSTPGRRQATTLYADLVESTPLAERYDVEIYSGVLRAFERACHPAIDEHEGHFVDLKGDALVACFGYPSAHEDDACRAVAAALDMLDALRPVAAALRDDEGIELQARIGIDTGVVVIDGAGVRGATLNRAARLQALAEPDTVVVSATTNELVADQFETRPLGQRQLKGVDGPVAVFQVLRPRNRARYQRVVPPRSGPFIGRDVELKQVLDLWEMTVEAQRAGGHGPGASTGAMALIRGEPGIGKSRLTAVVAERIAEAGMPTIDLQCSSYSVTSTLFPLRTAMERYANMSLDDTDEERLGKLEATLAGLQMDIDDSYFSALGMLLDLDLAGRYPVVELAPIQLREFLLDRLIGLLRAVGAYRPTVMVFEDLHWADPTTLELLDRMAATGPPAGLLILGTARPDLTWAPDPERALAIELHPLTDAQARELAMAAAPGPISERHAGEIAAMGDGVPLFVEQLAQAFGGDGETAVPRDGDDAVPRTLTQLLQARLEAAGSSKLVAQVAATIGREFDTAVLGEMVSRLVAERELDADASALDRHLDRLLDAQLIEPMEHEGLLRFRHVLMRDAAYRSQLNDDRGARHLAAAQVLASARMADPALTAFHFDRAGHPIEALAQYLQAVTRAQAAGAFTEVFAHLERCDALLASVPDLVVRSQFELAVRLNHGLAVSSTAGYAAQPVEEDYSRARHLCETLDAVPGVATQLLKTLFGVWTYYCASADFDTAAAVTSAIDRQLDRAAIRSGAHGLDACRGVEAYYRGDLRHAHALLSRAVEGMARDDIDAADWWQPHDPMAAAFAFLGPLRLSLGDETGALRALRLGVDRSQALEFPRGPYSVAFVRTYEALVHRRRDDVASAAAAAEEVIRIGEYHGFFDWLMVGRMHVAAAEALASGSVTALDQMGEAIDTWCKVGGEALIPTLLVEQADGYLARGHLDKASACLDRAFGAIARGQRVALAEALRLRADLRLRSDPSARAEADADLREALGVAREQQDVYSLLRVALTHRRLFDREGGEPIDAALADAVAAYGDETGFRDLVAARELVAAGGADVRLG